MATAADCKSATSGILGSIPRLPTNQEKGNTMYFIKFKGKKATKKALQLQFQSYEEARKALRKFLRAAKVPTLNLTDNFFSIAKI